jgi:hypothetical protein
VLKSCKVNVGATACISKVCADYVTVEGVTTGTALTLESHCSALLSTCTINNATVAGGVVKACLTKEALCTTYATTKDNCSFATEGTCIWNATTCVAPTTACTSLTGGAIADC